MKIIGNDHVIIKRIIGENRVIYPIIPNDYSEPNSFNDSCLSCCHMILLMTHWQPSLNVLLPGNYQNWRTRQTMLCESRFKSSFGNVKPTVKAFNLK